MARLWSSGFELQSVTAGVEFDSTTGTAPTIDTTIFRTGLASIKYNPSAATSFLTHQFAATSATNNYYVRFYAYFTAFPGANSITIAATRSAAAGNNLTIRQNTNGSIFLNNEQASTQVGATSSVLVLNKWYRIEFSYVYATGVANAYIDGVTFATGSANATIATDTLRLGFVDAATGTFYADDVAVNDNTGSFQTSLPDAGSIIHLVPTGAGDLSQWTPTGGANYTNVDETTPNDATDMVTDALASKADYYTVAVSNLSEATSSIKVVAVGGRFNNPTADVTTNFQFQIEKVANGTKTSSAVITPNTTTWSTNAVSVPRQYPVTTYQDPDSTNWTPATLGTAQIGVLSGTIGVFGLQLSTIWMLVDYAPRKTRIANYGSYISVGSSMGRSEVAN